MDWIAAIFELFGLYIVGNKNRIGFILNLCCGVCWIAYVLINKHTYGLLLVIIPAIFINIRNFIKWREVKKSEWKVKREITWL